MPNLQNVKYFMISFFITLLLFCFTGLFCYISIRGPEQPVFSYAQQDSLHGHAEFLGSGIPLDFTALEAWEQIRRTYAPLLTPRLLLTMEYAADYAFYWGGVLMDKLEEDWFLQESYGMDAIQAGEAVFWGDSK